MAQPTTLQPPAASATHDAPRTGTWDGGNEPFKASYGKLMMWFFLLSDAFTFAAFLTTYGMIRHKHEVFAGVAKDFHFSSRWWPIPDHVFNAFPGMGDTNVPLGFVALMTMILILSSVTMVLAVEAGHRMDKADVQKWLLWTILFGATFLGSQAWEWGHFIHGHTEGTLMADGTVFHGANLAMNQYGPVLFADLFFFITGFHGTHVFPAFVCWCGVSSPRPTVRLKNVVTTKWLRKSASTGTLWTWFGYLYSRSFTSYKAF